MNAPRQLVSILIKRRLSSGVSLATCLHSPSAVGTAHHRVASEIPRGFMWRERSHLHFTCDSCLVYAHIGLGRKKIHGIPTHTKQKFNMKSASHSRGMPPTWEQGRKIKLALETRQPCPITACTCQQPNSARNTSNLVC